MSQIQSNCLIQEDGEDSVGIEVTPLKYNQLQNGSIEDVLGGNDQKKLESQLKELTKSVADIKADHTDLAKTLKNDQIKAIGQIKIWSIFSVLFLVLVILITVFIGAGA